MRGEETQLMGLDGIGTGRRLACLPGTHSKWALVEGCTVTRFQTFMTGELYELLAKHSILRHTVGEADIEASDPVFADAVHEVLADPAGWSDSLFALRAGVLLETERSANGAARLSGLLVGAELAGAARILGDLRDVVLVASGRLGALYHGALQASGVTHEQADAETAVRHGLFAAARQLHG